MNTHMRKLSLVFAAGCVGGLVNSLVVWYAGEAHIPQRLGVALAPALSAPFVYSKIAWGGIWGLLFLLPFWKSGFWAGVFGRGVLLSFGPTLFQLLYVFPHIAHKGMFGSALGGLTPLFVVLYNIAWGLGAAIWLYLADEAR